MLVVAQSGEDGGTGGGFGVVRCVRLTRGADGAARRAGFGGVVRARSLLSGQGRARPRFVAHGFLDPGAPTHPR